jgi:hypothetical protein
MRKGMFIDAEGFPSSEDKARILVEFLDKRSKEFSQICSPFIGTVPDFASRNIQINFPHSEVTDSMDGGVY